MRMYIDARMDLYVLAGIPVLCTGYFYKVLR